MDNTRLFLYLGLGLVLLLLWQNWLTLQAPSAPAAVGEMQPVSPDLRLRLQQDVPEAQHSGDTLAPGQMHPSPPRREAVPRIRIRTDLFQVEVDSRGGTIQQLELRQVPASRSAPEIPYRLMDASAGRRYVMQSGLLHDRIAGVTAPPQVLAPSHHAEYTASREVYEMPADQEILRVPLIWHGRDIEVEKAFVFRRGSYLVEIEYRIRNFGEKNWIGRQYSQLRRGRQPESDAGNMFIYTFFGAAYYDGSRYGKLAFDELTDQSLMQTITGGWAAMVEHYFTSALVPPRDQANDYYTKKISGDGGPEYLIGFRSPPLTVAPAAEGRMSVQMFAGPKLQKTLENIAPGLELTTDYGIFTVLSKPLFWLLEWIYRHVGNWGLAIIALTGLIKLVFYKLSEIGYRSMARMRKFQPRIMAIRERCKGDRERMNKEMMEIYRQEKINPLGGCFPVLVQIPVFIALYWVLLESVELRQAPFVLWIHDLSDKDPFFVLPLLMGATMLIQTRLNPTPPDPIQAKIMLFLPLIFTFFFAFFPSGLVLYWLVNNVLSILQQWVITRRIEQTA